MSPAFSCAISSRTNLLYEGTVIVYSSNYNKAFLLDLQLNQNIVKLLDENLHKYVRYEFCRFLLINDSCRRHCKWEMRNDRLFQRKRPARPIFTAQGPQNQCVNLRNQVQREQNSKDELYCSTKINQKGCVTF